MFSKLLSASAVGLTFLSDHGMSEIATATFSGANGIEGYVMVDDGTLSIELNVSGLADMNFSGVTDGETCFDGGLKYHIHEYWLHNTTMDYLNDNGMCGGSYTGGHWDPWLACGSATNNALCAVKSASGCVTGSSALDGSTGYDCDSTNFDVNAYACEVGDWNGKYGLLMRDTDTNILSMSGSSSFEVDGSDIMGMSVVFHCNGGDRAFCAAFEVDGTSTETRDSQDDVTLMGSFWRDTNSTVAFYPDGTTVILLTDISAFSVPDSGCEELAVRIYNDWNPSDDDTISSYDDCGSDVVGMFYDPTVTCAPDSDSSFCSNGTACNSTSEYSCDYSTASDRFLCAPGDLTGKYGLITVAAGSATVFEMDDLMVDMALLEGKSVVVQCSDTWEVVGCAGIYSNETAPDIGDDDDDDSAPLAFATIQFGTIVMLFVSAVFSLF